MHRACLSFLFYSYTGILHRQQYLKQVFPAECKIRRHMKKKSTLDMGDFWVILCRHWVHSSFFCHGSMVLQQVPKTFLDENYELQ